MKIKFIPLLLAAVFLFTVCSCSGPSDRTSSSSTGDADTTSVDSATGGDSSQSSDSDSPTGSGDFTTKKAGTTVQSGNKTTTGKSSGTTTTKQGSSSTKLQVFPVPAGTPRGDIYFKVSVNGQRVDLYSDFNAWDEYVNYGYFNFDPGYQVTVTVETTFNFSSVKVLPGKYGIKPTVSGKKLTFTINQPDKDVSFVFDNNYQGVVLHLFTNPIDHNAPTESTDDIVYVGPGYYDLAKEGYQLQMESDKTLYVAGGAVIDGSVVLQYVKNVKIKGSGVIMMSKKNMANPQYGNIVVSLNNASNVEISGVIAQAYRSQNWTTHLYYSKGVTLNRYRVVSTRYASVDALDISNSQDITVTNCFLRACDDTITVKGLAGTVNSSLAPANENIHVSDTILWSDCNNAMVLGEESMAKYYKNISFKNIDVLYSYDDVNHHEQLDERAAISIVCLHGTYFSNIVWENIRVNECERLICFTFKDSFWFGSIQGNQTFPGGVDGVTLKNITSTSSSKSSIANQILLNGWSSEKKITNVAFNNVVINGSKVKSRTDSHFSLNQYVGTLTFS